MEILVSKRWIYHNYIWSITYRLGSKYLFDLGFLKCLLLWVTAVFAVLLAVYTAFLFAQAKGRDFWQSPTLPIHMLVHSVMAGAAVFLIVSLIIGNEDWIHF